MSLALPESSRARTPSGSSAADAADSHAGPADQDLSPEVCEGGPCLSAGGSGGDAVPGCVEWLAMSHAIQQTYASQGIVCAQLRTQVERCRAHRGDAAAA